jgi:iron complex outermembrane receptor protein
LTFVARPVQAMKFSSSRYRLRSLQAALAAALPLLAHAQADPQFAAADATDANGRPLKKLGVVTVTGGRGTSLPSQIPTTIEGITAEEIAQKVNATDAEDALKYLPSLLVRKRYIGDYNHAVLSSRASGTGNSARSMVYADGILLSNYLGNGAGFTPRWGLVTPEEIERVDVLYGPFSAAYPGNSVGAVVDYVTRMPTRFEAHAKVGAFTQPFDLYGTHATYRGWQGSLSVGDKAGNWSWWANVNRLDSNGQPLTFATRLVSAGKAPDPATDTPVTGAVPGKDKSNQDWLLLGTGTQYHTVQDHAKLKLAYDFGNAVRLAYTLGVWDNRSAGQSESYLRRSDGSVFYSGTANIGGRDYTLAASDFAPSRDSLVHVMHGLSLASRTGGSVDWELAASSYAMNSDLSRAPTVARPAADTGGAGRITDGHGTGWDTLSLKAILRPSAEHQADVGVQRESYRWRQAVGNAADWLGGAVTSPVSSFRGNTGLRSVYAQDAWTLSPRWKAVLGGRLENWVASGGAKTTASGTAAFPDRSEDYFSPKAALGFQLSDDWTLKLSTGRAVRMPTVAELYQGNGNGDPVSNPDLRPERSWTTEFSAEWSTGSRRLRATVFHEDTRDALYSQAIAGTSPVVNSTQNIDHIRTIGVEAVFDVQDLVAEGLDLLASVTYADSTILSNSSYVSVPGDTNGRQQPRVPKWRASLVSTWRISERWSTSFGARYGGRQYGTLNNSDPNGFAYQGFSKFFTTDWRTTCKLDKSWTVALGIDNLNNAQYWNFHPYPQRTYSAELKYDL